MNSIEQQLTVIEERLDLIEGRLVNVQTLGTWLFVGLLASYAMILVVALRV
jgi:hypothetical protein